jgi:hypothetical protein
MQWHYASGGPPCLLAIDHINGNLYNGTLQLPSWFYRVHQISQCGMIEQVIDYDDTAEKKMDFICEIKKTNMSENEKAMRLDTHTPYC